MHIIRHATEAGRQFRFKVVLRIKRSSRFASRAVYILRIVGRSTELGAAVTNETGLQISAVKLFCTCADLLKVPGKINILDIASTDSIDLGKVTSCDVELILDALGREERIIEVAFGTHTTPGVTLDVDGL